MWRVLRSSSRLHLHVGGAASCVPATTATTATTRHIRTFASATHSDHVLSLDLMNKAVLEAEYAVRGKLVIMAGEFEKQLTQPAHGLPFEHVTYCNIGNPQSVGQAPLTFPRHLMSLVSNPSLLKAPEKLKGIFPADAIARAQALLAVAPGGTGAYTHSKGISLCRESVARYINERDGGGGPDVDPENVFLTNGASHGIAELMRMTIRDEQDDGVLIPIPQYPLYSATAALLDAKVVPYYLDETKNWSINFEQLQESLKAAKSEGCQPRAMVVINPGNPTGQVLSLENMKSTIELCVKERLILIADEVYQTNIYGDKPFHSFRKVLYSMGPEYYNRLELASFHSTSKGFLGECGYRGGYMELVGFRPDIMDQIYKLMSIGLCSNVSGQVMTEAMVNPPKPGDESYELYCSERDEIMTSLKRKAQKCAAVFNSLEGMSCNEAEGAMYLFPRVTLPAAAKTEAEAAGVSADALYCTKLLEATGICVVPGSGFGQEEGTWHFRTTFLPSETHIDDMLERMRIFHQDFMKQYS